MTTVMGHRTGATLITALVSSYSAKNLFQRAWASSGSVIFPHTVLQLAERANQHYLEQSAISCSSRFHFFSIDEISMKFNKWLCKLQEKQIVFTV